MKKVLLLVVALAALALPASASASGYSTWTMNGEAIPPEALVAGTYTGKVGFTHDWHWGTTEGSFYCDATVAVLVQAGETSQESNASIVSLEREASTCEATGHWHGIGLAKESNNIGEGWDIDLAPSTPKVTKPGSLLDLATWYGDSSWSYKSQLSWYELDFVPTVNGAGEITSFMLEGMAKDGVNYEVYGPFTPSGGVALGLE